MIRMMRTAIGLLILSMVFSSCSCSKKPPVKAATSEVSDTSPEGKKGQKTEVATGEMRDLLLTLQRVHFPFDDSTLTPEAREALITAAQQLIAHPEVSLYVDGHTDSRGTTEYNMSLGERRAQVVVEFLKKQGVEKVRFTMISHGEEEPMAKGSDEKSLAMNRRVEFRLLKGDVQLVLEEGPLVDDEGMPIH